MRLTGGIPLGFCLPSLCRRHFCMHTYSYMHVYAEGAAFSISFVRCAKGPTHRSVIPLSCCLADGVPILLRICKGRRFEHGPFSLGRWYLPVGVMALSWVVVSTVRLFTPVTSVATCMHVPPDDGKELGMVSAVTPDVPRAAAVHACLHGMHVHGQVM